MDPLPQKKNIIDSVSEGSESPEISLYLWLRTPA